MPFWISPEFTYATICCSSASNNDSIGLKEMEILKLSAMLTPRILCDEAN
jgi:hypothetical protein